MDARNFNGYTIVFQDHILNNVDSEINRSNPRDIFDYHYAALDTTRSYNGVRIVQTIDYIYKYDLSICLYIIENYIDDEETKAELLTKLNDIHNKNLEYEKEHPPIVYKKPTKKKKAASSTKEPKVPKEKIKVAKLNMLKLKLK